jgi:hypothetical protein
LERAAADLRRISLAEPVLHPWLCHAVDSPVRPFLGLSTAAARRVALGRAWIVDSDEPRPRVASDKQRVALLARNQSCVVSTFFDAWRHAGARPRGKP